MARVWASQAGSCTTGGFLWLRPLEKAYAAPIPQRLRYRLFQGQRLALGPGSRKAVRVQPIPDQAEILLVARSIWSLKSITDGLEQRICGGEQTRSSA